jgi:hypothetical protein
VLAKFVDALDLLVVGHVEPIADSQNASARRSIAGANRIRLDSRGDER